MVLILFIAIDISNVVCIYRIYTVNNFGIYVLQIQECIYYRYIQEHTNNREDLE